MATDDVVQSMLDALDEISRVARESAGKMPNRDAAATDMGKRDALEELSALVHHYSMGARLFHGYQRERSAGSLAVMHAALAAAKRSCEETAATEEVRNADDAA